MQENQLYIAYGSNLNLPQMAERCPNAEVVGPTEIKGYELLFRGGRRGGVATIEPCESSAVPVLLWEVTPQDEKALDCYEGFPYFYHRETVDVEIGGKTVPAMVYVMNDGHQAGMPSDYYLGVIQQGYRTAGFNSEVLDTALDRTMELMAQEQKQSGPTIWNW